MLKSKTVWVKDRVNKEQQTNSNDEIQPKTAIWVQLLCGGKFSSWWNIFQTLNSFKSTASWSPFTSHNPHLSLNLNVRLRLMMTSFHKAMGEWLTMTPSASFQIHFICLLFHYKYNNAQKREWGCLFLFFFNKPVDRKKNSLHSSTTVQQRQHVDNKAHTLGRV